MGTGGPVRGHRVCRTRSATPSQGSTIRLFHRQQTANSVPVIFFRAARLAHAFCRSRSVSTAPATRQTRADRRWWRTCRISAYFDRVAGRPDRHRAGLARHQAALRLPGAGAGRGPFRRCLCGCSASSGAAIRRLRRRSGRTAGPSPAFVTRLSHAYSIRPADSISAASRSRRVRCPNEARNTLEEFRCDPSPDRFCSPPPQSSD